MGRLFIGYGQVFDNHSYVGAELGLNIFGADDAVLHDHTSDSRVITAQDINGNIGAADINSSLTTRTRVTRNTVEPTLDLKLGFLMTPTTLVFLRGGLNYNNIKIQNYAAYVASGLILPEVSGASHLYPLSASTIATPLRRTHNNGAVGYRAGVGMEVMVTPQLGVSADYVYSWYRNTTAKISGPGSDVACDVLEGCLVTTATQSAHAKVQTDDQQVLAQLIYHFG
jgi:opacity protein-like surface antigen